MRWACCAGSWRWAARPVWMCPTPLAGRRCSGPATMGTVSGAADLSCVAAGAAACVRQSFWFGGSMFKAAPDPSVCRCPRCPLCAAGAVERLLQEGASPWRKDCNQRMPLHFASEAGALIPPALCCAPNRTAAAPACWLCATTCMRITVCMPPGFVRARRPRGVCAAVGGGDAAHCSGPPGGSERCGHCAAGRSAASAGAA